MAEPGATGGEEPPGEGLYEGAPQSRATRRRVWMRRQTKSSLVILGMGVAALALPIVGTILILMGYGLTPYTSVLRATTSSAQLAVLWGGIGLGAAAAAGGWLAYGRMPSRDAREACISAAALGVQAILFGAVFLVLRSGENFDFFVRQFMSFELLGQFAGEFVIGARNTVFLALTGEGLGIVLGLFLALLTLSTRVVVRAPARGYINLFRGTPLLLQLSVFYSGLVLGTRLGLGVFASAIIVLGLNAGAYTAEIFRAGIQSIERGQMEAARSLGMTYMQAMRYAILPQAIRRVIPPLTNEFVILIKDTSLVAILGLTLEQRELFKVGGDAYAQFANATPYIGSALGYMIVTLPMIRLVAALERRLRSGLTGVIGG